jgi:regulator of protease activity HflC (stomatin/prohibitin superfamily)
MMIIALIGYVTIVIVEQYVTTDSGWRWSTAWLWISGAYILSSLRIDKLVNADQIGVRLLFGAPTDLVHPGLPVVPPFIFTLERLPILVQQLELPGEPEDIFRGEMKTREPLPDGMVPPIRIPFRTSITEEEARRIFGDNYSVDIDGNTLYFDHVVPDDGLSNRRITAEVVLVIRYRIQDAISFIRAIGSLEEANRQIEDTAISLVNRIFTKMSLAQALNNLEWMSAMLFREVERRTGLVEGKSASWGLDIENANVKLIELHHDLNTAIGDANEATFRKQSTITDAEAEQVKRYLEGKGAGQGERELLAGRTAGFKKMVKTLGVNPEIVIGSEMARNITDNPGQKTIITGMPGFKELLGGAAAFGSTLRNNDSKEDAQ